VRRGPRQKVLQRNATGPDQQHALRLEALCERISNINTTIPSGPEPLTENVEIVDVSKSSGSVPKIMNSDDTAANKTQYDT